MRHLWPRPRPRPHSSLASITSLLQHAVYYIVSTVYCSRPITTVYFSEHAVILRSTDPSGCIVTNNPLSTDDHAGMSRLHGSEIRMIHYTLRRGGKLAVLGILYRHASMMRQTDRH